MPNSYFVAPFSSRKSASLLCWVPRLRAWLTACCLCLTAGPLAAQTPKGNLPATPPPGVRLIALPAEGRPAASEREQVLRQQFGLSAHDQLRPLRTETDELGFRHERYQQYYRGVKVEHAQASLHIRGEQIEALGGDVQHPPATLRVQPALNAAAALQAALATVGARSYKWQFAAEEQALKTRTNDPTASYYPKGELVLVGDFRRPAADRPLVLAWKFNVYAHEPVSRDLLYVDAQNGQVVLRNAVLKHVNATGTFATRYLGPRTSSTDNFGSGYRLRETVNGKGVTTLNLRKSTVFASAIDFTDNDNNWTAAEHANAAFDNAALDAHLGAQTTQNYWTTVHGRDSYDDKGSVLLSYVHYGNAVDNAYWDGDAMLYGDGNTLFRPLTAVDVCGHEIGHAVCETTADLVYRNESGALNEALSDIWGACVENHLDPTKQIWLIGEDITKTSPSLRSMSNPNAGNQPDTYLGTKWATGAGDNGGVHTNSGVLNFWFYLLSVGGAGTNDNGTAYNVPAITIGKAARLTYRAERLYMTANTTYTGARLATMQAAIDLYGLGSAEVTGVAQAWRAVGLDEAAPTITSFTPASGLPGTTVTLTGTNLGTTFSVNFNGTTAPIASVTSPTQVVVTVPGGATTGPISLTTPSGTVATATNFVLTAAGPAPAIASYTPAGGQVQGGSVTLTGANFTGATAVRFNGVTAVFTVVNATTITATVPATATTGPLTVTTPNGTATAPTVFLVLPAILGFTPTSGIAGTAVVITGTSFTGALSVKFNGTYATSFTVNSATQLTANVAVGTTTGPLEVRTPSGTATSASSFTLTPSLAFNSFSPTSAATGAIVTLRGRGFTGTSVVTFGGVSAPTFTVASDLELWATVPVGAQTGLIGLVTPLGAVNSPQPFAVLVPGGPLIASFTPSSGPVGTNVALTGTNFTGATAVHFNGTAAAFTVVGAASITTTVPAGATTGPITVTTPVGTGLSSSDFALPPANDLCTGTLPVLTCGAALTGSTVASTSSGDPTGSCSGNTVSGAAGGVFYRLTGTGTNLTVATCTSNYDGVLYVYSGTCGSYTCVGSDDDGCGNSARGSRVTFASVAGTQYLVFVGGFSSNKGDFTITLTCPAVPVISSFTPPSGPAGTVVTLAGTGFTGTTAVRFSGVAAASFTVNSATELVATVPAAAVTGPLSLTTLGGTATSATNYTVPAGTPTITGFTPTTGLPNGAVTLTGTNFSGATAVSFNGTAAAFSVINNATITTAVPVGATSGLLSVTTPSGVATSVGTFTVLLPPANDLCTAPALPTISCNSSVTGTTVNATTAGDPTTTCAGNTITSAGVFYRYTGTGSPVTLSTCGGVTNFDTKLFVFSGTCGSLVCVASDDDAGCGITSEVTFTSVAGTSYLVFVTGFSTNTGLFTLSATCPAAPPAAVITGFTPPSGLVGTVVALTGTGFTGTTAVQFNGTAATVFSVGSATSITATVPAAATTGPISVVNPFNTATSAATFRVLHQPVIGAQSFSLAENTAAAIAVGTVMATDSDPLEVLTYSILAGNTGGAFGFVGNQLVVTNSGALDFEATPTFSLTVQVSDDGPVPQSATATITVNLLNVNESPTSSPQSFSIAENSAAGTTVGNVVASDPDAGTTLAYAITGGNANGAFAFAGSSLRVASAAALDFETSPTFSLTVVVSDGALTTTTPVTVNLTDVVETAPDLTISGNEPVPAGTYRHITVLNGGVATLAGPVTVEGNLVVQAGGLLRDGCQVIDGPGTFALAAGAALAICHPQGIAAMGAVGMVQVAGNRSFAADATYTYNGSQAQVTGTGLPPTVRAVTIDNPANVLLSHPLNVRQVLTVAAAGNLVLGDSPLTLLSDATGTALVVNGGSGVVLGTATVQRYLTPGSAPALGYRHLAAPVGNTTVADLAVAGAGGFTPVINANYNGAANPATVRPYPTVFGFDESRFPTNPDFGRGYFSPAALSAPLVPGRGYSVYMRPLKPDFVGTLTNGPVVMANLTHTGSFGANGEKSGWHLLGNPYPAPLDWDLAVVPAGMDASISVFKSTGGANGAYLTRANGQGSLPAGLVAMGQAFFARVSSLTPVSFTFTNALRVTEYADPAHYRPAADMRPVVSLTLAAVTAPVAERDETVIYFEADATAGADARHDGFKPARNTGTVPTLASVVAGGGEAAVNGLPTALLATGTVVELLADLPAAGTYTLAVNQWANLAGQQVVLLDRLTGTRYELATQPALTFTAAGSGEVSGRFALLFTPAGTLTAAAAALAPRPALTLYPNPAHGTVLVGGLARAAHVELLDATGRVVRTGPAAPQPGPGVLDLHGLPAGVYTVRGGTATARLVVE